jgi:hypothetical protein
MEVSYRVFSLNVTADSIDRCKYTPNFEAPVVLAFSVPVPKGTLVMKTVRLCNEPCKAAHRNESLYDLGGCKRFLLQLSE